jgi:hypothetical protein
VRECLAGGPPFHLSGSPTLLCQGDTGRSGLALIPSSFLLLIFIAYITIAENATEILSKCCYNVGVMVKYVMFMDVQGYPDIQRIWNWSDIHAHG